MNKNHKPSILDRVADWLGYIKQSTVNLTAGIGSIAFASPPRKQFESLQAYVGWVYACAKARAFDVRQIKLHLYRTKNRKTGEVEEVFDHEVLSLLRLVNPWTSFRDLIEQTQIYKDLAGESFWWLVRNGEGSKSKIVQIWLLRPDWMRIEGSKENFVEKYIYQAPGRDAITFTPDEIIHHKEFNPTDMMRGMSVVKAAATTIDAETFAEEYNRKFFENSAIPSVVLQTEQRLDEAIVKRMRAQWYNEYGSKDKAHKVAILEGGLDIKPFSISQKDMEFLAGMNFSRDKILALFGVPKTVLGITEDVTVSNAEATDYVFQKRVVKPLMEKLVDTLNEFLLSKYGDDLFFGFDDPVPENEDSKLKKYQGLFAMGAITPNEIRAEEGLDEVDGLDNFYIPFNVMPLRDNGDPEEDDTVKGKRLNQLPAPPPVTITQKITHDISAKIKEKVMSSLEVRKDDPPKDELGKTHLTEEQQESLWKMEIARSEGFEQRILSFLREHFNRQENETIRRLHEATKALSSNDVDKVIIDLKTENKIMLNIFVPLIKEMMEKTGNDVFDFLGLAESVFDMRTQAVQQFLESDAVKGIKVTNKVTRAKLRDALANAIKENKSIPDTAREIRKVFAEANVSRSKKIARTEVLRAQNRSTLEAYRQSGIVAGKQFFTALDERVCEWCAPMHGRTKSLEIPFFYKGESFIGMEGGKIELDYEDVDAPPLHPNCRCTLVPILGRVNASYNPQNKEISNTSIIDYEEREQIKEELHKEIIDETQKMINQKIDTEIKKIADSIDV